MMIKNIVLDMGNVLLDFRPEFVLDALPGTIPERFRAEYTDVGLQLLPHRDGLEGFFIARLRRVK